MYAYAFALMIVAVAAFFLWRAVKNTPSKEPTDPQSRQGGGGGGPSDPDR